MSALCTSWTHACCAVAPSRHDKGSAASCRAPSARMQVATARPPAAWRLCRTEAQAGHIEPRCQWPDSATISSRVVYHPAASHRITVSDARRPAASAQRDRAAPEAGTPKLSVTDLRAGFGARLARVREEGRPWLPSPDTEERRSPTPSRRCRSHRSSRSDRHRFPPRSGYPGRQRRSYPVGQAPPTQPFRPIAEPFER